MAKRETEMKKAKSQKPGLSEQKQERCCQWIHYMFWSEQSVHKHQSDYANNPHEQRLWQANDQRTNERTNDQKKLQ